MLCGGVGTRRDADTEGAVDILLVRKITGDKR